ncbi:MAG: fibronectin type III domain-containing protein [Desulfobacterales bacterium]
MRRLHQTVILTLVVAFPLSVAWGFDVTLAWDPNSEPDIGGYTLYARDDSSGSSSYRRLEFYAIDEIDPNNPSCEVTAMQSGITYHFVVTAITTEGLESGFSNEVSVLNGEAMASTASHTGGGGCFVSTSTCQGN